jgi:hypothetical protein
MMKRLSKNIEYSKDTDKYLVMSEKDIYEITKHDFVCIACCVYVIEKGKLHISVLQPENILNSCINYLDSNHDLNDIRFKANVFKNANPNSFSIFESRIDNALKHYE